MAAAIKTSSKLPHYDQKLFFQINVVDLLLSGICLTGSAVGGSVLTQECMDFFAEKDIR
jgi:D-arabinose 1-dehydrogenase-like Zn-dependent alcohol dehydrogenase